MTEWVLTPTRVRPGVARDQLQLSWNRKTTPAATWDPRYSRWVAKYANSFGLPAETTCPGRTRFCEDCYVLSTPNPGVADALEHNWGLLRGADEATMERLLSNMLDSYREGARRAWLRADQRIFRIHWSGDFFSPAYARAWAGAMAGHADTTFFAYTRSFVGEWNVVPILAEVTNLHLYLSIDEWNAEKGVAVLGRHPEVRAAWCAPTHRDAAVLAKDVAGLGPRPAGQPRRCPENARRLPMVVPDRPGPRHHGHGACQHCQLCPQGRADISFAVEHQ